MGSPTRALHCVSRQAHRFLRRPVRHAQEHHWRDRDAPKQIRNITAHTSNSQPASKWCSTSPISSISSRSLPDCAKYRGCTKFKGCRNLRAALRFSAKTPLCYSVPSCGFCAAENRDLLSCAKWFPPKKRPRRSAVLASHQGQRIRIRFRPGGHRSGDPARDCGRRRRTDQSGVAQFCRKFWKPRAAAREGCAFHRLSQEHGRLSPAMNEVYGKYFALPRPPVHVEVARLPKDVLVKLM